MGVEFQILVEEFIANMWEVRKQKLYGNDSCPNQLQSQSLPGGLGGLRGKGMVSSGKVSCIVFVMHACRVSVGACNVCVYKCKCDNVHSCECKCKCDNVHSCMDTCTYMCSSAHSCGCVDNGGMLYYDAFLYSLCCSAWNKLPADIPC